MCFPRIKFPQAPDAAEVLQVEHQLDRVSMPVRATSKIDAHITLSCTSYHRCSVLQENNVGYALLSRPEYK